MIITNSNEIEELPPPHKISSSIGGLIGGKSLDESLNDLFELTKFDSKIDRRFVHRKSVRGINLKSFDGAFVIVGGKIDDLVDEDNCKFFYDFKETKRALYRNHNIKFFVEADSHTGFLKSRKLSIEDKRHYGFNVPFDVYENKSMYLFSDAVFEPYRYFWYVDGYGRMYELTAFINSHRNYSQKRITDQDQFIKNTLPLGIQFTKELMWTAYIKEDEFSIGVEIPIQLDTVRADLDLKAIYFTRSGRRKAIMHWVTKHIRRTKSKYSNEVRESMVKKHLRGETTFRFGDFVLDIVPSVSDVEVYKLNRFSK